MIILFDLDGTLIDSTEAILESFGVAFKHFGDKIPDDKSIKSHIGHPLDVMFVNLGVDENRAFEYISAYKEHYRQISCAKTVLLPFARETLKLASQYATLGVVTTKTAKYSIELLEYNDIMRYFEVLVGREDVENPKPHPEPILKALSKLQIDTSEIWMVGDTCMDMSSASSANIKGIAVTCGYGTKKSLESCSDIVVDNAFEAVKFITVS
ncbi:MAG: HAD family hydrolase [Sulfurovum sp.]